jgi:hypothetical protein
VTYPTTNRSLEMRENVSIPIFTCVALKLKVPIAVRLSSRSEKAMLPRLRGNRRDIFAVIGVRRRPGLLRKTLNMKATRVIKKSLPQQSVS